jgi:hypothetical protein
LAGLTVHIGSSDRDRIARAARRIVFFGERSEVICEDGFAAAWAGHDDPTLFGPAYDPVTGIRVMTSGRVAWDETDWQRAERLTQYEGGLSNRLLVDLYLQRGAGGLDRANGACMVVVWDPRVRVIHLWTDHFGYHPAFLYRENAVTGAILSTFPEAIADDPETVATLDEVSVAEFLSAWRITPPHTYYREIRYAGAATHYTWNLASGMMRYAIYWRPHDRPSFPSCDAAAEELAFAVSRAIRIRTLHRLAPIVSFTSGGMDSRTVLFAASSADDVIGLNLFDEPNHESEVARRLCEAAQVRYVGFRRDQDYYPRWLEEGVRLSGAMWSHEDNHYLGTRARVVELGARTVLSACTTDWLFKGYGLERAYRRLLGRNLPFMRFEDRRIDGFLPNVPRAVPKDLVQPVRARLAECFGGTSERLTTDADRLQVEDRRVRPACYAVSVSGQIMYRIFPYDTFLADARIADCYGRVRAEWKLNSDLWGRTVRRICFRGRSIEDANYGWAVGSSPVGKMVSFAGGWVRRRVRRAPKRRPGPATGSWPDFSWYIKNSVTLRESWSSVSQQTRDLVARTWGSNPWGQALEAWSGTPNEFFRILTVAQLLENRSVLTASHGAKGR